MAQSSVCTVPMCKLVYTMTCRRAFSGATMLILYLVGMSLSPGWNSLYFYRSVSGII